MRKILKGFLQNMLSLLANIRKWDWSIILLCIFISSIVWIFNALNSDNYSTKLRYPISVVVQDSQAIALTPPPSCVSVSVSGMGWSLLQKTLGIGVKPILITLSNPIETKSMPTRAVIEDIEVGLRDVRLNAFIEDSLYFNYDSLVSKKVPIRVDSLSISLAKDYRHTSPIEQSTDSVTFYGPSTYIAEIADSLVLAINEKGIEQDFSQSIRVDFDDRKKFVRVTPQEVEVNFEVALYIKRTERIAIQKINFPEDASAYIDEDSILLDYYTPKIYQDKRLIESKVSGIIDFTLMNRSDSMVVPAVEGVPSYIKDYQVLPPMLRIKFRPAKSSIKQR